MVLTRKGRKTFGDWIHRVVLVAGGCFMLIPLAWMVCTALKDDETYMTQRTRWKIALPKRSLEGTVRVDRILLQDEDLAEYIFAQVESPDETWESSSSVSLGFLENDPDPKKPLNTPVGERCLTVTYDLRDATCAQWSFSPKEPLALESALGVRFFFHGDSSGHVLNVTLQTRDGDWVLEQPFRMGFTGWRELEVAFREEDTVGDARTFMRKGSEGPSTEWDELIPLTVTGISFRIDREGPVAVFMARFFENFSRVAALVPFGRYYLNTMIVVAIIVISQLVTSSLAGYAFARLDFPGRDKIFYIYLGTMMVPVSVTMIPQFLLIHYIGWFDSLQAVVVPGLASVYGTFLLRQFFKTIPRDLEDAARIDGCSSFGILTRIILPLSKPAMIALAVSSFIGAWGLFQWPLIVTESQKFWTLQIGLAYMTSVVGGQLGTMFNVIMAGALIVLIPQIVIFFLAQNAFQRGIVLTGLKG